MLRIGECVVHTVHDGIYTWAHIRRTLGDERVKVKESLPAFAHGEGAMGCVTVMKKALGKQ